MTTVVILKDKEQQYRGIICMGHAGFAKKTFFGKAEPDILCAAISVLLQTTLNALEELAGEELAITENEESGFLKCDLNSGLQDKSVFLLDAMVYGLEQLRETYGETYLQVNYEEV